MENFIFCAVLVRGNVTIIGHKVTQVVFKNCAPFTKCIPKNDLTTRDDVQGLDQMITVSILI